ncbi:hypothetical protein EV145_11818 [Flavobacterium sp. 245]|nr:hypothetical protein EV145_11818 [Flavobacterium sp. 245]
MKIYVIVGKMQIINKYSPWFQPRGTYCKNVLWDFFVEMRCVPAVETAGYVGKHFK